MVLFQVNGTRELFDEAIKTSPSTGNGYGLALAVMVVFIGLLCVAVVYLFRSNEKWNRQNFEQKQQATARIEEGLRAIEAGAREDLAKTAREIREDTADAIGSLLSKHEAIAADVAGLRERVAKMEN